MGTEGEDRYSTIWLAKAVPEDGSVTTLELVEHNAKVGHTFVFFKYGISDASIGGN
mgnify:CR=1 FL=1